MAGDSSDRLARYQRADLARWASRLLVRVGLRRRDALRLAAILVDTDAEGIPTHGLTLLPRVVAALEAGEMNPRPDIHRTARRGAVAHLDGDNGPGQVVAWGAMQEAIRRARRSGAGLVAVSNTNHFGAAGTYTQQAALAGCWGLAVSNSRALVAPAGASRPLLGTNPISLAAPGREGDGMAIDLSTAASSRGKIRQAAALGRPIAPGLALDARGRPTTDAASAMEGFVLPMGGQRGLALGLLVELLAVGLGGARLSVEVPGPDARWGGLGLGQLFLAVDPGALERGSAERVSTLLRETRAVNGRAPGDRRRSAREHSDRVGVALPARVEGQLRELGRRVGLAAPFR